MSVGPNSNESPSADVRPARELVEMLRQEIIDLESEVDDVEADDASLPHGLRALLADATISPQSMAAVDEILSDVDPVSERLAVRIRTTLAETLFDRGPSNDFFERVASRARARREVDLAGIATELGVSVDIVSDVEHGARAIDDAMTEAVVAKWIRFLDLDLEEAVASLERSLVSPAKRYRGDSQRRPPKQFVAEVRKLLGLTATPES